MRWLVEEALTSSGAVLSWVNPEHPGYAYPKAAGLLLALLAQDIDTQRLGSGSGSGSVTSQLALCRRIFDSLRGEIDASGAVGRSGQGYLFDTGIVVHGLLRYRERLLEGVDEGEQRIVEAALERAYAHLLQGIRSRRPVSRPSGSAPRWSEAWGCHLLKLALPLTAYARSFSDLRPAAAIRQLIEDLMPLGEGGRFVIHSGSRRTYTHACCYAAEGLLAVDPSIDLRARPRAVATATWLASIQEEDGGLPAWHDGVCGEGPYPTDVVAQCVRLWAAIDRRRFSVAIARGLGRLSRLQSPSGGLAYAPGSADANTWTTIFAAQAIAWAEGDRTAHWLV